ncbi:MAG: chromosome segregation ATPase, partial [Candidatus Omnitrophota bacterium]
TEEVRTLLSKAMNDAQANFKNQLEGINEKNKNLGKELQVTEANGQDLQRKLITAHKKMQVKDSEGIRLSAAIEQVKEQLAGAKGTKTTEVKAAVEPLKKQLTQLNIDLAQAKNAIITEKRRVKDLEKQVDEWMQTNKKAELANATLTKIRDELSQNIKDIPTQLETAKAPLISTITTQGKVLKQNRAIIKSLKAQVSMTENTLKQEQTDKENTLRQLANVQEDLNRAMKSVEDKVFTAKQLMQQKIDDLKDNLLTATKIGLQKDVRINEIEKISSEASEYLDKFEKEKASLEAVLTQAQQKVQQAKEETAEKIELVERVGAEKLAKLKNEIAQWEEKADILDNEARTQEAARVKLQDNIPNQIKQIKDPLVAKVNKLTQAIVDLTSGKDKILNELASLKNELKTTKDSIPSHKSAAIKPFERKITQLKNTVASINKDKEALNDIISGLKKQYDDVTVSSLKAVAHVKSTMKNELDEVSSLLSNTKRELTQAESKAKTANKSMLMHKSKNKYLEAKVSELAAQTNNKLSAKSREVTTLKNIHSEEIDAIKESASMKDVEINKLNDQIASLIKREATQNETISDIKGKLARSEQSLSEANQKVPMEVAAVKGPLQERIGDLEKQIIAVTSVISDKEDNIKMHLNRNEALDKELESIRVQLAGRLQIEQQLEDKIENLNGTIENNKKHVNALESEITENEKVLPKKLKEAKTRGEVKFTELKRDISKRYVLKEEKEASESKISEQKITLSEDLELANKQIISLGGQIKELTNQNKLLAKEKVEQLTNSKKPYEKQLSALNKKLTTLKESIPTLIKEARIPLEDKIKVMGTKLSEATVELDDTIAQIDGITREKNVLAEKLEILLKGKETLQSKVDGFKKISNSSKSDVEQVRLNIEQIREEKIALQEEITKLTKQSSDYSVELVGTRKQFEEYKQNVDDFETEIASLQKELVFKHEDEERSSKNKFFDYENKLKGQESELSTTIKTMNSLKEEKITLAQDLAKIRKEKVFLEEKVLILTERTKSTRSVTREIAQVREPLEAKINALEKDIKKAKDLVKNKDGMIEALEDQMMQQKKNFKRDYLTLEDLRSIKQEVNKTLELIPSR